MKNLAIVFVIGCSSNLIHSAEKRICLPSVSNALNTPPLQKSSMQFQEWPAEDYAQGNTMQISAFSHFLEANKIEIKNKRILSVGCGTGELEAKLAEQAQSVLGIDASSNMIQYANMTHVWKKERRDEVVFNFTPKVSNLEFVNCPAEYVQTGKKFDLAISSFAFHWFSDKEKALKNIADNLETNGLFFVNIPTANNPVPVDLIVAREMINSLSNRDTGSSYPTEHEVTEMFTKVGFEIVIIKEQSFTWNPTKEQYSQRQWPVFISRPLVQSMPEEKQQHFFNELIDRCLAKLPQNPNGTYTDVYTGTIVLARKK